ncbi:unnamed protein product [Microthlaspi erraticum]|uniref:Uncharacterized protein n=1 Tax=Microthlaspi erraticum TaxID=1685480 RepID=A0A6D2I6Y9_9BRAS|nr:unnamed protein product [Microthlaspi erraticum]
MQAISRNDPHRGDHHSSTRSNPGLKGLSLAGTGFRKEKPTRGTTRSSQASSIEEANPVEWSALMAVYHLQTTTLPPSSLGGTEIADLYL